jgi:hypothetical protein
MTNFDSLTRTWTAESEAKIIVYLTAHDLQEFHYLYFRGIIGRLF